MSITPDLSLDPRAAGAVKRFHTWMMLREQSVAEHSWNVTRILLAIWPDAPRTVITTALFHDVGEVATGDVPSYAKQSIPRLKTLMDEAETNAHYRMCLPWGVPPPGQLDDAEKRTLKLADRMELLETGIQELAMGNQLAGLIVARCKPIVCDEIDFFLMSGTEWIRGVGEKAGDYLAKRVNVWGVT